MKIKESLKEIKKTSEKFIASLILVASLISWELGKVLAEWKNLNYIDKVYYIIHKQEIDPQLKFVLEYFIKDNNNLNWKILYGILKNRNKFTIKVWDYIIWNNGEIFLKEIYNSTIFEILYDLDRLKKFINLWKYKDSNNIVVIFRSTNFNNKFVLLYYKDWYLKLATFVSPGKYWPEKRKIRTPSRDYKTDFKKLLHKSKQFKWAWMPFATYLWQGGIYAHTWEVNWYPLSWGCIRMDMLSSVYFYYQVPRWIPVVFKWYKSLDLTFFLKYSRNNN